MRASGSILPALPMTFTQTPANIDNSSSDMLLIFFDVNQPKDMNGHPIIPIEREGL